MESEKQTIAFEKDMIRTTPWWRLVATKLFLSIHNDPKISI